MSDLRALAQELANTASRRTTVYLFGSYARGDATPHSDVDLLVVQNGLLDWLAETVRLQRVIRTKTDREVDLVVMGTKDWNRWRRHFGTIQHAAAIEGIRLVG